MATLQRMTKMNISNEYEIKKCAFDRYMVKQAEAEVVPSSSSVKVKLS